MTKRATVDQYALNRVLPTDLTDRIGSGALPLEDRGKRQHFYLSEDLVRRVKILARRQHISASDVAKLALEQHLRLHGVD
ncbi:MAG: hypothetical protein M1370_07380 [Bacteroidetes bacterium]|nr:hypothetical protein [Bacteroidota bacterium]